MLLKVTYWAWEGKGKMQNSAVYERISWAIMPRTSLRTVGTTTKIVGKAMAKAFQKAPSHFATKPSMSPRLIKVMTKDMKKDMKSDIRKAKRMGSKRLGITVYL